MAIINSINLSSLDGNNGFSLDGGGELVSNAGDINGDGFDDVIVGYLGSHVVFGKASGFSSTLALSSLDGNNGFHLVGMTSRSVSNAGDINGDGFDDVIIGTDNYSYDINSDGFAGFVVFGKASGFDARVDLLSLDGNNGFSLNGVSPTSIASTVYAVNSAGDVNGDGFDDVTVGGVSIYGGVSYVVFGKAAGFGAGISLRNLDGSDGFRLVAEYDFTAGYSVSSAGDVNGDGFDDVIIGAPVLFERYYGDDSGSSYVVFGKASGFDATLDLHSLDGGNGFRLSGAANDWSGFSVSNAGDVNGDGFDDLIIAAPKDRSSDGPSGSAYVVFGKASNFSATMDLSSVDGSNGFRLDGVETGRFPSPVSNAGDVNGDGFDDLIIGSDEADPNGDDSGSSYVVFGRASGFSATINLSSLDSNTGVRLDGVAVGDNAGASVSGAEDVNGDGFDDLIIGSSHSYINPGASYVIFGSSNFSGIVTFVGTAGDDTFTGTTAAERFEGNDGNDMLIGGGGKDIFQGGNGNDVIRVPDLDFQTLDGGTGTDTLDLTGGGIDLNLANFHDTINAIETIDLTGSGDNTLTFSLPDLLTLSDTTHTFTVNGNSADRVIGLGDGWGDGGLDGNYQVFTNRGTAVRVDVAVSADSPTSGIMSLSSLNGSNGFRLDGVTGDYSGRSVSSAGDVNGDGFDDVIIGASFADPNGRDSGSSYVVFGKASGFDATLDLSSLDGNNGFSLNGGVTFGGSGQSVSSVGDVNGDGFDDVIVGAYYGDRNGSNSGSSYVVFGKAAGFGATLNLSELSGSNGFRLEGTATNRRSGYSVSSAGDVNGDGFADVIVGASFDASSNGTYAAFSYVVFGKASGFDASLDLSSLDGNTGFRVDGVTGDDESGESVSSAGDVNGDGFDDVIIGDPYAAPNGSGSGSSYVVFGKAAGFDATLDLSSLDGNNGFRLDGAGEFDTSGRSVSNAGDVNGDGFDDLIIGANGAYSNGDYSAVSYVVFGKATGFDAAMNLSNLDGSNGFRLDGVAPYDSSDVSVSNAGDFNGDGFDDLIVGSAATSPSSYSDVSYVVFGKASGFDAAMSLSNLDGNNGLRLDGVVTTSEYSDISVSSAGDVNGDGFDDLIVGDPDAPSKGENSYSGSSYVIFGRSDFGSGIPEIVGTPGDDQLKGTTAAEHFKAGDGDDNMIGRGGADIFEGGAGDDAMRVADLDFASVDGGAGNDVLHLAGDGLNLNLADFGDNIRGIETICLFGKGDNTLTLTAADLLNLSDTTNTLKVNGNAAGHISVQDSGWVDGGNRGQGYFHVYTNDEAVLLVGMNVTIDFA